MYTIIALAVCLFMLYKILYVHYKEAQYVCYQTQKSP